ncbi:MAG TPA: glutamine-hydrolyzing carbamoyl-phosphate synthase small subunit [Atribacter sp.]|jgi:carbamoyl-phosphate synthase small subunit|uniref:Carbamoyl phosphate synthase small chain n=1 Tax=Candidatus Atribacter allofermentans TaxID=1852833 RepID=A0A1V5SVG3_9BACT|nr:glutamine-hydrolyzing carbamoyl-phosphate synthase small subunit [Atribacter sp.]MDD3713465.1 glutamine-hydrolyzing carbamoyl-phosphate synthase small subunit [Atribacterota bacterium]OQA58526.1 MAG: Carbamoyl-phosphate synthase small chain [Candidatus Atribacteria bacterium ADurb.Bin276]HQK82335.1 glutamine-hydrolyzing carbamoyl-phosphate synthase small subunit [Atribacter sp.]
MKTLLALEDGRCFWGHSFGSTGEAFGEIVFNTSMTGYQEILTDPSYCGQIVTMTYPLIGNYGLNSEDGESSQPQLEAFIVREKSPLYSNWRAEESLDEYLIRCRIIGMERVDTRAITRHIREKGALKAVISTEDLNPDSLVQKAIQGPPLVGVDLAKEVTTEEPYFWQSEGNYTIAVIDFGVKYNILRQLAARGCRVKVYPAKTTAHQLIKDSPDGVLLSNGPGDPAALHYAVELVQEIIGKLPVFGICLGHQIIGQALGGKTYKLKFGHHGGNHPVKDLLNEKVYITTQNHSFVVDVNTLPMSDLKITHINLNDNTLAGIKHCKYPLFSVQFHPEAAPGSHDTTYLFDQFVKMMEEYCAKK